MRTYPTGWTQLARMRSVLDNSDPGTVTTDYTQLISQDHVNFRSGPFSPPLTAPAQVAAVPLRVRRERGRCAVGLDLKLPNLFAVSTPVAGQLVPFANRVGSLSAS
jgi:hypothetical protein